MALSGVHIECGYAGGRSGVEGALEIHGRCVWSESLTSPATTTNVAPAALAGVGDPVFRITAAADVYVAIGPAPNATTGPRRYVKASEGAELLAQPGDKLAWILVP